jgi:hypothetical protein
MVRAVCICKGERYAGAFVPEENFKKGADNASVKALLVYDGAAVGGDSVINPSRERNDGRWERTP